MLSDGMVRVDQAVKKVKKKNIMIAVAGGSCSGKTTFSRLVSRKYSAPILSMDDYYKGSPHTNFDVPSALDLQLLRKHISLLRHGRKITCSDITHT